MPENLIDLFRSPISRQFEVLATALQKGEAFSTFISSEMAKMQHEIAPDFVDILCPLMWEDADHWWEVFYVTKFMMDTVHQWKMDTEYYRKEKSLEQIINGLRFSSHDMQMSKELNDLLSSDDIRNSDQWKLYDLVMDILLAEELDSICADIYVYIVEETTDEGFYETAERLLSEDEKNFLQELTSHKDHVKAVVLTFALKFASSK